MKRPLLPVVLAYAGGVLLADAFQPRLDVLFSSAILVSAVAIGWERFRYWLLWVLIPLVGWVNLSWRTAILAPNDLRRVQGDKTEIVRLRGVLEETPDPRMSIRDEKVSWRSLAYVNVTKVQREQVAWRPAVGRVLVTTPGVLPSGFFAGQQVEVEGLLTPPPAAAAEGLFDYRAYLSRQGIHYLHKAGSTNQWRCLGPLRSPPFADRFLIWAQRTLARGLLIEDEQLRLLWAMTLGWKAGLDGEVYEPFMLSGTLHIFAISGLHIILIGGFLSSMLWIARVPRAWSGWIVIPLIWFYTAATGWQPSAVRATIMMSVIITGYALRRPSNLLNSLAAAAFIILLWDPQQLFGASFQLSFSVVLSLALIVPPLQALAWKVRFHDPLLPEDLAQWWKRAAVHPFRWFIPSVATSFAAWMGALPLTAYYFHIVSPVTLLANLVVVPLSSLALAANLGSLIAGGFLPWVTEILNHSAWALMTWMVKVSQWAAGLPGGYFNVSSPSVLFFLAWYGALFGLSTGWVFKEGVRRYSLSALGLSVCLLGVDHFARTREASITTLPLNGGMSVFATTRTAGDWLVDTGNRNPAERVLKPFLRAQGVDRLDNLLLTHGDSLHVGGAADLSNWFRPTKVFTNSVSQRSSVYRRVLAEIAAQGCDSSSLNRSQRLGPWQVLHPDAEDRFSRADDAALALLGEFSGTRVLLLPDLGYEGQRALLKRNTDLRADVVIAGLPSIGQALCEDLLDAIQPGVVVVCDSEFPEAERADAAFRTRLEKRGIPTFFTQAIGAIKLTISSRGWELAPSRSASGPSLAHSDRL